MMVVHTGARGGDSARSGTVFLLHVIFVAEHTSIAAAIGNQRASTPESESPGEATMLTALWNDCQLEIKKVHESDTGDKHDDAEAFLGLIYSGN